MPIAKLLAALLRGEHVEPADLRAVPLGTLLRHADHHGVGPLVAEALQHHPECAESIRAAFRDVAKRHVAADLAREVELRHVLQSLAAAGVRPLLLKGAQLAYTHYRRPDLRPRVDTDILIPIGRREVVQEALARLDYVETRQVSGDVLLNQAMFVRQRDGVVVHAIDVHWKMANAHVFANVLRYDELAREAVPVVALGSAAYGLPAVHALLFACVHRVAHHADSHRLIWLYDLHLLGEGLAPAERIRFVSLAGDRGVLAVCQRSFELTLEYFPGSGLEHLVDELRQVISGAAESTAAYLSPHRRHLHNVLSDLRALQTWSERWRLVRQHMFPPATYMRDVYAPASGAPLSVLYAWRAVRGARKWLARAR